MDYLKIEKELVELFANDSNVKKSFAVADREFAYENEARFKSKIERAKKLRSSSAGLKAFLKKYKIEDVNSISNPVKVVQHIEGVPAPIQKNIPKPKEVKEVKEVLAPVQELPKPFTVGAYHLNMNEEVCKIISAEIIDNSYNDYFEVEYLNLETMLFEKLNDRNNSDMFKYTKFSEMFTKPERYKPETRNYLLRQNIAYTEPKEKIGILGLKYNKISVAKYVKIDEQLKAIEKTVKELTADIRGYTCNSEALREQNKNDCLSNTKCDLSGKYRTTKGSFISAEIYSFDDLKIYCDKQEMIITKEGLYSIGILSLDKLKDKSFVLYIPEHLSNIMIMLNLCIDLDRSDTARQSISTYIKKDYWLGEVFNSKNDMVIYKGVKN